MKRTKHNGHPIAFAFRAEHPLKAFIFLFLLLCSAVLSFAQNNARVISGKIKNDNGELIPGATIMEKNSKTGAISDNNGNYSIRVSGSNTILVISATGFTSTEIPVGERNSIDITLQNENKELNEIVVIGYGARKKTNLTGAVSAVTGKELQKSPAVNITNSLAGQVPGLIANTRSGEPGNDNAEIFVRGKATLGSTGALVVIDGVPDRSGGFARLNPADIESISVIKDATAAIYGARSANGVILVTTRRGRSGTPVLSFSTNWGFTQPTRVPEMLNSYEYAVATNEYDVLRGQQKTWPDADLQLFKDGSDPLGHPSSNWWDATMKTWAMQQNHVVSLSGGTEKVKYYLSGQYQHQDGIYRQSAAYYKQAQARANIDVAVTNNFKVGIDVLYRNEFRNAAKPGYDAGGIFRELWLAYPYLVPKYPNGYVGPGIGGGPDNSMIYITNGDVGYQRFTNDYLQTKASFNWDLSKITDGLSLDGYYAYDLTLNRTKAFVQTPPPAYRYNPSTKDYTKITSSITPNLNELRGSVRQKLLNLRVNYSRKFDDHTLEAFVAFERFQGQADNITAYRSNFLSNSLDELFAGSLTGQQNNSSAAESGRINYISRISYNFRNKYLLDYNMRYDGSQNFPEGKRYGFFPGVSAAWRISQESFFRSSFISDLKLRASWGKTGNDAVSAFNYIQTYLFGTGFGYSLGANGSQVSSLNLGPTPNRDITWEVANTTDLAVESQFLNGRIGLSLDYFRSMRRGILIARSESVPGYTGLTLPLENLGRVLNRGIEVEASYNNSTGKDFSYSVRGNMTFARNKVIYMDEAKNIPSYQQKTNLPIDAWFLYQSDGIYQNQREIDNSPHPAGTAPGDIRYKDLNNDKQINGLDMVRMPLVRTPEIIFGTAFNCTWKNIDVSIFFQGQARAQSYLAPAGLNLAREFFTDRWQKEGDNTYPRNFSGPTGRTFGVNTMASDFWLRNAAFVRLKNVEIGYNLPSSWLGKAKIQGARIYVNGNNLFSIDKFGPSYDPEIPNDNGYYYPQQRIVNIGANLSF